MLIECISTRHDGLKISVESQYKILILIALVHLFLLQNQLICILSLKIPTTFTLKVVNTQTLMFLDKLFNTTSLTLIILMVKVSLE